MPNTPPAAGAAPGRAMTPRDLEKYSSAVTLSDMEMFIFPELVYALLLANLMSPRIWAWRADPWFRKLDKLTPYRRVLRLKQYIIDHYEFNLDLDTWGLTTKPKELARFQDFVDPAVISASNALFGYEGDKYYFDLDIRRHFGLDKYNSDVIPYWKTETVEAMDAFRYKPGFRKGAGECVSLAALYAAGLFLIGGIPLDDIFMMATPLHSQNFVDLEDGILTNNRRVVTHSMWFNGTELTAKAQRALRHERVTFVTHHTGHIHIVYPEASMDPAAFQRLQQRLAVFLRSDIDMDIVTNFLRQHRELQACFQLGCEAHDKQRYIPLEKVYPYEANSSFQVNKVTRARLLAEIDEDEFYSAPLPDRIPLNQLEQFFLNHHVEFNDEAAMQKLVAEFHCVHGRSYEILGKLAAFVRLAPRLPDPTGKTWAPPRPLAITPDMRREDLAAYLQAQRAVHPVADLAFYAYRDLSQTAWDPFVKAALERNPVAVAGAAALDDDQARARLEQMPNESIYEGPRLAQPDEVWNYGRGDGWERALCLADILRARRPGDALLLESDGRQVRLKAGARESVWPSAKGLPQSLAPAPAG